MFIILYSLLFRAKHWIGVKLRKAEAFCIFHLCAMFKISLKTVYLEEFFKTYAQFYVAFSPYLSNLFYILQYASLRKSLAFFAAMTSCDDFVKCHCFSGETNYHANMKVIISSIQTPFRAFNFPQQRGVFVSVHPVGNHISKLIRRYE